MRVDAVCFSEALLDPLNIIEERELYRTILQAVQALPPAQRQAALLFYYAQFRLHEIAAILGISVVAVKGRLHKARKQLRKQLLAHYQWTGEERNHSIAHAGARSWMAWSLSRETAKSSAITVVKCAPH